MVPRTDIHQHLWPEQLLSELSRRSRAPYLRSSGRNWRLVLDGEPDHLFHPSVHDPDLRRRELAAAGIDRALIAPSLPLGIEGLPTEEAAPLVEAHNAGALELGPAFGVWGTLALRSPEPSDVDALLDEGVAGIALPAGALRTHAGLARSRGVLSRLEERRAPLLVHPGPDPYSAGGDGPADTPAWWPAMTAYVADMNAAWHALAEWGRPAHPRLRVVFAMLAGGAIFQLERLRARGGPAAAGHDDLFFYDVSSYGPKAVDAAVRAVGIDQLVYGSDRPVVDPEGPDVIGAAAAEAMLGANADRALNGPHDSPRVFPIPREVVAA